MERESWRERENYDRRLTKPSLSDYSDELTVPHAVIPYALGKGVNGNGNYRHGDRSDNTGSSTESASQNADNNIEGGQGSSGSSNMRVGGEGGGKGGKEGGGTQGGDNNMIADGNDDNHQNHENVNEDKNARDTATRFGGEDVEKVRARNIYLVKTE